MVEIIDLRSKVGREAYINNVRRKWEGKKPHEIALNTAVTQIQSAAMNAAAEWALKYGESQWKDLQPGDLRDHMSEFVKSLLKEAHATFDELENDHKKYIGPSGE